MSLRLPPRLPVSGRLKALKGWLNQLLEAVRSLEPVSGPDLLTTHSTIGVSRIPLATQEVVQEGGGTRQYKLVSVSDDHVEAHEFNGTSEGSSLVKIAKPYKLRRSPFDNNTIAFVIEDPFLGNQNVTIHYSYASATFRRAIITAAGVTIEERQVVIPQYRVGDIFYASPSDNGTAVSVAGAALDRIDDNRDGRAWSRKD